MEKRRIIRRNGKTKQPTSKESNVDADSNITENIGFFLTINHSNSSTFQPKKTNLYVFRTKKAARSRKIKGKLKGNRSARLRTLKRGGRRTGNGLADSPKSPLNPQNGLEKEERLGEMGKSRNNRPRERWI